MKFSPYELITVSNVIDHVAAVSNDTYSDLMQGPDADLMLEAATLEAIESTYFYGLDVAEDVMTEAITTSRMRIGRTMKAFIRVLNRHLQSNGLTAGHNAEEDDEESGQLAGGAIVSRPRKSGAIAIMTAKIPLSDGQAISVIFHAPNGDPSRITNDDTLFAFRFLLNSRDVTHTVAPNGGSDISLQQSTLVLSNIAARNSQKFQDRQAENKSLENDIESATNEADSIESEMATLDSKLTSVNEETEQARVNLDATHKRIESLEETNKKLRDELEKLMAVKPQQNVAADIASAEATVEGVELEQQSSLPSNVRNALLKEVWEKTHSDFKTTNRKTGRMIMTLHNGGSTLVPLDNLTDKEIGDKLGRKPDEMAAITENSVMAKKKLVTLTNKMKKARKAMKRELLVETYEHVLLELPKYVTATEQEQKAIEGYIKEGKRLFDLNKIPDFLDYHDLISGMPVIDYNNHAATPTAAKDPEQELPGGENSPESGAQKPEDVLNAIYENLSRGQISLKDAKQHLSIAYSNMPKRQQHALHKPYQAVSKLKRKASFLAELRMMIDFNKHYDDTAPRVKAGAWSIDFNIETYDVVDEIGMFGRTLHQIGMAHPEKLIDHIENHHVWDALERAEGLKAAKARYAPGTQVDDEQSEPTAEVDPDRAALELKLQNARDMHGPNAVENLYGLRARPPGIGAIPGGQTLTLTHDEAMLHTGGKFEVSSVRHGLVAYKDALPESEVSGYELVDLTAKADTSLSKEDLDYLSLQYADYIAAEIASEFDSAAIPAEKIEELTKKFPRGIDKYWRMMPAFEDQKEDPKAFKELELAKKNLSKEVFAKKLNFYSAGPATDAVPQPSKRELSAIRTKLKSIDTADENLSEHTDEIDSDEYRYDHYDDYGNVLYKSERRVAADQRKETKLRDKYQAAIKGLEEKFSQWVSNGYSEQAWNELMGDRIHGGLSYEELKDGYDAEAERQESQARAEQERIARQAERDKEQASLEAVAASLVPENEPVYNIAKEVVSLLDQLDQLANTGDYDISTHNAVMALMSEIASKDDALAEAMTELVDRTGSMKVVRQLRSQSGYRKVRLTEIDEQFKEATFISEMPTETASQLSAFKQAGVYIKPIISKQKVNLPNGETETISASDVKDFEMEVSDLYDDLENELGLTLAANEPEPAVNEPDPAVNAVSELNSLLSSDGIDSGTFMDRFEAALDAIEAAGLADEHSQLIEQVSDKVTEILDQEEAA
ncbi:hypothetical protein [Thaumasiovibrio sp. DFM-14]|uniref:defense against restriction DarA-related protein n=1 Tax=Thaumasiovibrio sp. DFM-14 TaxID=3384792 RepID=UPI0039A0C489